MGGLKIIPDSVLRLGGRGGLRVSGGGQTYAQRLLALSPIAYWPLNEAAGTSGAGSVLDSGGNGYNATPTSVTFGVTGIGDGKTAADFNGAASIITLPAGFRAAFNGAIGTAFMWVKLAAPEWSDGTARVILNITTDTGNSIVMYKSSSANLLQFYRNGSGAENYLNVPTAGNTAWATIALTWTVAGNAIKAYYNGVQAGATQSGVGVFTGTTQEAMIGSNTANFHKGQIAHVAIFNKVLSVDDLLGLSSP